MRRPWQQRETVELLPNQLDTRAMPWCREARLLHVRDPGALRWEQCGERENNDRWRRGSPSRWTDTTKPPPGWAGCCPA